MSRNTSNNYLNDFRFLISYLVTILIVDVIALIGQVWVFYLFAAAIVYYLWGYALHSDSNPTIKSTAQVFFGWQIPFFLISGILFQLKLDPISTYWIKTWPALLYLITIIVVGGLILYQKAKSDFGFAVVETIFLGAIAFMFRFLPPPAEGVTSTARWIYENCERVAYPLLYLFFIAILGRIIYKTTETAEFPEFFDPFLEIRDQLREWGGDENSSIEIILRQIALILNAFFVVLGSVLGIILYILAYVVWWLRDSIHFTKETIKAVYEDIISLFRFVILQGPLHYLSVFCLWLISNFTHNYIFQNELIVVYIIVIGYSVFGIATSFLVSIPLIMGREAKSNYQIVIRKLYESLLQISPHVIFVFCGVSWSLILLTELFEIGSFSIGPFTIVSTISLLVLIIGGVWLNLRRQEIVRDPKSQIIPVVIISTIACFVLLIMAVPQVEETIPIAMKTYALMYATNGVKQTEYYHFTETVNAELSETYRPTSTITITPSQSQTPTLAISLTPSITPTPGNWVPHDEVTIYELDLAEANNLRMDNVPIRYNLDEEGDTDELYRFDMDGDGDKHPEIWASQNDDGSWMPRIWEVSPGLFRVDLDGDGNMEQGGIMLDDILEQAPILFPTESQTPTLAISLTPSITPTPGNWVPHDEVTIYELDLAEANNLRMDNVPIRYNLDGEGNTDELYRFDMDGDGDEIPEVWASKDENGKWVPRLWEVRAGIFNGDLIGDGEVDSNEDGSISEFSLRNLLNNAPSLFSTP